MKYLALLLICTTLFASETMVESDNARYDGNQITLKGHVVVENDMGRLSAGSAILLRDTEKSTDIDFPWIELYNDVYFLLLEGRQLKCDKAYLDHTKQQAKLVGNPLLHYFDGLGEVYANTALVDYAKVNGKLQATKVTLIGGVQMANSKNDQYALAEEVEYYPQEELMWLRGHKERVLFYDRKKQVELSARVVRAQRDVDKRESVEGVGDVRFLFGAEELKKLKQGFAW
ncbi:MAG: hypothetical protein ACKVOH_04790 [Chlamydiales bacterium]